MSPPAPSGTRAVLANAGWLYADQAVRAGVTLVAFGLMTRALGPEGIGRLSYAQAFAGFLLPVALAGLDYVVIREFVTQRARAAEIFGTAFRLKLAFAFGASALGALAAAVLLPRDEPTTRLVWIALLGLWAQPFLVADLFFQSHVAARFPALARMASCLLANGVRVALVAQGAPLSWFVGTWVAELGANAVALAIALRASGVAPAAPWRRWDGLLARRLLAAAWPLALADVAIACYLKLDQLLINHLVGAETLGRYAAAMRLGDALEFLPLAIIGSYFPRIVAAQLAERAAFERRMAGFFTAMTWAAIGLALAVTLAGPRLAPLALGAKFAASAPVLVLLVWGNVFATQIAVRGRWYLVEGLQVFTLVTFAAGAAVHLGLLLVLAPRFGALGAAACYVTAQATMALLVPWAFEQTRFAGAVAWRSFAPGLSGRGGPAPTASAKTTDRAR